MKVTIEISKVNDSDLAKSEIANTDRQMARFSEDLFDVLKEKGIIEDSDFKLNSINLMTNRKAIRSRIKQGE